MGKLPFFLALACLAQDAPRTTGWVVIPVSEYAALRGRAMPVEPEPAGPPVEATLSRVEYDLQVKDNVAIGHASLTIDVLKDGWVRVPIPPDLLVKDARLAGKPLSLVNGAAVLSDRGRSVIAMDVALPVNVAGGEERLALPARGSPWCGPAWKSRSRAAYLQTNPKARGSPTAAAMSRWCFPGAERSSNSPAKCCRCACAARWCSWSDWARTRRHLPRK